MSDETEKRYIWTLVVCAAVLFLLTLLAAMVILLKGT